jgi:NAD(P)H-dependent FMN reductase
MTIPRIGIILSTTRPTRFADQPADWLLAIAGKRQDMSFEVIDLRDYPIPFFDAPRSPVHGVIDDPAVQRLARRIGELDGFIFVTAEYNHSISGVLKNALDHVYAEFNKKPAAFLAYGGTGGARAVEQLRLICVELDMTPMRAAVHINMEPLVGILRNGKTFADYPYLATSAEAMLEQLSWWTRTLRTGRDALAAESVAA